LQVEIFSSISILFLLSIPETSEAFGIDNPAFAAKEAQLESGSRRNSNKGGHDNI